MKHLKSFSNATVGISLKVMVIFLYPTQCFANRYLDSGDAEGGGFSLFTPFIFVTALLAVISAFNSDNSILHRGRAQSPSATIF